MAPEDLRRRREALRLTQLELAALLHVDPMTVSRWERGLHPIPEAVALALQHMRPKKGGTKKGKR